jgi:hypothetical protein
MSASETLADLGRNAARSALKAGGERAAQLDSRPVPRRVIARAVPAAMSRLFDPDAAGDLDATFELKVTHGGGSADSVYSLRVTDRRLDVARGAVPAAGAGVSIGADDMLRMVSGGIGWPELLAQKRLTLSGDPFLALRFPKLFRLPT